MNLREQLHPAFEAGLWTAPIGIILIGIIIVHLIRQIKKYNGKYQPVRYGMLFALVAAEVAYVIAFAFDFQIVVMHEHSLAAAYLWTNVISRLLAAVALPVVFFYKVKD